MKIQDGQGKGYEAQVDDHGRLYVKSNHVSHMSHHATYHKDAFMASGTLTAADGNEAPLFFIKNTTNDSDIEIYNSFISSDSNTLIQMYSNAEYSSGGDTVSPINTNLASSLTKSVSIYQGGASDDLVLTTTNAELMWSSYVGAYSQEDVNWDGMIVLPPGKSLYFTATGAASDVVKITIAYAWHSTGTAL